MLGTFERLLISRGYGVYSRIVHQGGVKPQEDIKYSEDEIATLYYSSVQSSNGRLFFIFRKSDIDIYYGLNEKHHAPCLIYPRPIKIDRTLMDKDIDKLFMQYSHEEILNAIETNTELKLKQ